MTPEAEVEVGVDKEGQAKQDASTQTEMDLADLAMTESKVLNLEEKLNETEKKLREVEKKLQESKFSLNNIKNNDTQVTFFTGFPSFLTFLTSTSSLFSALSHPYFTHALTLNNT